MFFFMAILQTVPILNESVNFISLSHKDVAKNVIALCLEQVATFYKCDDFHKYDIRTKATPIALCLGLNLFINFPYF